MSTQPPRPGTEAKFLRECATFASLSSAAAHKIVRAADRVSLPANWPLVHENTPGDACYILLSGSVGVYIGRDKIAELGPGDVVGEVALRQGTLRSATVSTQEPVEMLRIEGPDFSRLAREVPGLQDAIDATIARHTTPEPSN